MFADVTPASWAMIVCICAGVTVLALAADATERAPLRAMWRSVAPDIPDIVSAVYLIAAGVTVAALSGAPSGSLGRDVSWGLLGIAVPIVALLWLRLAGRAGAPRPLT